MSVLTPPSSTDGDDDLDITNTANNPDSDEAKRAPWEVYKDKHHDAMESLFQQTKVAAGAIQFQSGMKILIGYTRELRNKINQSDVNAAHVELVELYPLYNEIVNYGLIKREKGASEKFHTHWVAYVAGGGCNGPIKTEPQKRATKPARYSAPTHRNQWYHAPKDEQPINGCEICFFRCNYHPKY